MESQIMHTAHIVLPCVRSHTLMCSCFGSSQREGILAAGACCGKTCCVILYFDTSGLKGITPSAAELRLTLQDVLPPGCGMKLFISSTGGGARIAQAFGPGELCVDVFGLVTGHAEDLLRLVIRSDWPCGALARIESCGPAPCIVVTPDKCQCSEYIRLLHQDFELEFNQSGSTPDIDTAIARQFTFYVTNTGDAPFTANLDTCAQVPLWICEPRQSVAADETRALVARFYGARTRVSFSAEGAGRAKVRFIGQYFA